MMCPLRIYLTVSNGLTFRPTELEIANGPVRARKVIEDFFRLLTDALFFYPERFISSELFAPIFSAAVTALTLEQRDPVTATLHFLRDLLGYGTDNPPSWHPNADSPAIRAAVQKLVLGQGEVLVQRVLAGMMFTFPRDCFPDASGVLLDMFHLVPNEVNTFVGKTIQMLPGGTISQTEAQRLLASINQCVLPYPPDPDRTVIFPLVMSFPR